MRYAFLLFSIFLFSPAIAQQNDPDTIRDAEIAKGTNIIAAAWLVGETQRYPHYVRGTSFEAEGLRVRTDEGAILTLWLDEDHVFEDRTPRLADLDNDGRDEISLVLTSVHAGSALAIYTVEGEKIVKKAQTPFIGTAFRWLNPAGIADFNGDGQKDIAFVAMPHLVKRLEFWTFTDGKLRQIANANGYSNHRNGSPHTGMSAIADFNGDGVDDLALPDADRRSVRILGFDAGKLVERMDLSLGAAADGNFNLSGKLGRWVLRIPTDTGVATLRF